MKNCLVLKLKESVNNDNLPLFGIVKTLLVVDGAYSVFPGDSFNAPFKVKAKIENGHFENMSSVNIGTSIDTTVAFKATDDIYPEPATLFTDVLNSTFLRGAVNFDELQSSDTIVSVNFNSLWNGTKSYHSSGDIKNLTKKFPNLQYIRGVSYPRAVDITELFGTTIKMLIIDVTHSSFVGSLEELAATQVNAGRTDGTLSITAKNVTYNGEKMNNSTKVITFDSSIPNGYSIS